MIAFSEQNRFEETNFLSSSAAGFLHLAGFSHVYGIGDFNVEYLFNAENHIFLYKIQIYRNQK